MKRLTIFIYGLTAYAVFFATFLYSIGFIGNLWVPKSMDSPRDGTLAVALAIELMSKGITPSRRDDTPRSGVVA